MADSIQISHRENSIWMTLNPDGSIPSQEAVNGVWKTEISDCQWGNRFNHGVIKCTPSYPNALAIMDHWRGRMSFEDIHAELWFMTLVGSGHMQSRVSQIHSAWAEHRAVPKHNLQINPDLPLAPYQQVAAAASRLIPGYALFMEQGTGKSAVAVSRMCTDAVELQQHEPRMLRVLIVCPKNIRRNWMNEIDKFSTCQGKVAIMRGGAVKRVRELAESLHPRKGDLYSVVITSYGLLCQAWDTCLSIVEWDLAIVDEAHAIKWHQTDRTQTCHKLRDRSRKRMALTGTPIVNSALDLYSIFEFLDRGMSGFSSYSKFKEQYAEVIKLGDHGRDVVKSVRNIPLLKKRLGEVSFIVRKDEVLKDLPEKYYDIVEVEFTAKQSKDYTNLAKEMIIEIEKDLEEAEAEGRREIAVNNALVKLMKLAQIASGFLIVPEEIGPDGEPTSARHIVEYTPNPKLDGLVELLQELPENEKVLVWATWDYDHKAIHKRLTELGIEHVMYVGGTNDADRVEAERRINEDPTCRVFVGNPDAGGAGLNLLGYVPGKNDGEGSNVSWNIYYSQSHRPVSRWQSEDRSHRRGTRVRIRITDLVVTGTIDEDIRVKVLKKKMHAMSVQDIREILIGMSKGNK